MRWTEGQLADHLQRRGAAASAVDVSAPPFSPPHNEAGAFARGRLPSEKMNKTEAAYAGHLELLKRGGEVLWYRFEPLKLRLADGSFYTPDFGVLTRDCLFELHETKGFWREAARVRIKIAASIYPFKFIAIKRTDNGGWAEEVFG